MAQSIAFTTGFETGDSSDLSQLGVGASIQSTTVRTGGWALKAAGNSRPNVSLAATQTVIRFYFRVPALPGVAQNIITETVVGNTQRIRLRFTAANKLQALDAGTTVGLTSTTGTASLVANTWYRIEFSFDLAAGGAVKVSVNGVTDINTTHTTNVSATPTDSFFITGAANPNEYFFDDIRIDKGGLTAIGGGASISVNPTCVGTVSLSRLVSAFRTISATATGTVSLSLIKSFLRTIAAAAAGTVAAATNFIAAPTGWAQTFAKTLADGDWAWGYYTIRMVIPASALTTSGNWVRITMQSGSGSSFHVAEAYIGNQSPTGDAYDFESTPVRIKVGGSGDFTIPINSIVVSDPLLFALDETRNILLSIWGPDPPGYVALSNTGTSYYKNAVNDAAGVDVSSYGGPVTQHGLVSKIEVGVSVVTTAVTVIVNCAGSVVVVSLRAYRRTIAAASTATVATAKAINKAVAVSAASIVTAARLRSAFRTIAVTSTAAVTLVKQAARAVTVSAVTTVTMLRTKAFLRIIAATATAAVAIALRQALLRTINTTATGAVAFIKAVTKTITAPALGTVNVLRPRILARAIAVAAAGAVTSIKSIAKTVNSVAAGAVTRTKTALKTVNAASVSTVVVAAGKQYARLIAVAASAAVAAATNFIPRTGNVFPQTITVALTSTTVFGKFAYAKIVAAPALGSVTVRKAITHTFALTATGTVAIAKSAAKITTVVALGSVSVLKTKALLRTIAASATTTVAITAGKAFLRTIMVTVAGAVITVRDFLPGISAYAQTVTVAATTTTAFGKFAVAKIITVPVTLTVGIRKAIPRTVAISAAVTVVIAKQVSKILGSLASTTVTVLKEMRVTVSAAVLAAVSVSKTVGKKVTAFAFTATTVVLYTGVTVFHQTVSAAAVTTVNLGSFTFGKVIEIASWISVLIKKLSRVTGILIPSEDARVSSEARRASATADRRTAAVDAQVRSIILSAQTKAARTIAVPSEDRQTKVD